MKPISPSIFIGLQTVTSDGFARDDDQFHKSPLPDDYAESTKKSLAWDRRYCADLGLTASVATLDRLLVLVSQQGSTWGEYYELGKELQGRLQDELMGIECFSLTFLEATYYTHPTKDWEVPIARWPNTQIDIEESSRCFAFARYAAAIFHVLLVAEFGVIEVAKLLGVAGDKPGWGALARLERIVANAYNDRSPIEQEYSELLTHTLPLMLAIRDSWRHKISHVENKLEWMDTDFSPQLAEEIMKATRGFMRRLAADFPETSTAP